MYLQITVLLARMLHFFHTYRTSYWLSAGYIYATALQVKYAAEQRTIKAVKSQSMYSEIQFKNREFRQELVKHYFLFH